MFDSPGPGLLDDPSALARPDRSNGCRALVPDHAVRRYAERALGLGGVPDAATTDREAVALLAMAGVPVGAIRGRLAYFGGVGLHHGARAVTVDGVELVLSGNAVVTVLVRTTLAERHRARMRRAAGRHHGEAWNRPPSSSRGGSAPFSRFHELHEAAV